MDGARGRALWERENHEWTRIYWNNYIDAWKHGNGMMQYYLDAAYADFKGFFTGFFEDKLP